MRDFNNSSDFSFENNSFSESFQQNIAENIYSPNIIAQKKQAIFNSLDDDLDNFEYNLDDLEGVRNNDNFSENFLEENLEKQQLKIIFEKIFARNDIITTREMEVLLLLYGIDDDKEKSLGEVGEILGIWPSAVQKARNSAFAKIRRSEYAIELTKMAWNQQIERQFYRGKIWEFRQKLQNHIRKIPSKSALGRKLQLMYRGVEIKDSESKTLQQSKELYNELENKKGEILKVLSQYYNKELRDL